MGPLVVAGKLKSKLWTDEVSAFIDSRSIDSRSMDTFDTPLFTGFQIPIKCIQVED
uniref:Uncharacterized protein n=1 Tax=Oryza sativa subsp. japonica TaxID=39947 RepID=Q69M21_ORYSJ|nr:hypothetical protein [Oryza sativa Japonica Group]